MEAGFPIPSMEVLPIFCLNKSKQHHLQPAHRSSDRKKEKANAGEAIHLIQPHLSSILETVKTAFSCKLTTCQGHLSQLSHFPPYKTEELVLNHFLR